MKWVLTGATGFIGGHLAAELAREGEEVWVLARPRPGGRPRSLAPGVRVVEWSFGPTAPGSEASDSAAVDPAVLEALEGAGAVVHLAGESIAGRRWTPAWKERLRASRIGTTRALVGAIAAVRPELRPRALVSGSAVGYYGPRGDEPITEEEGPGNDFLAELCRDWEAEALRAEGLGVRVARIRTGFVLGRGGALPRLLLPFRLGLGGPLGSGRQWLPWIHVADEVGLIRFLAGHEEGRGPFNAVAPHPVTNRDFSRILGRVLRRPALLPAPAPALRLALGEMADALLLGGQRALPARAEALGYRFRFPEPEGALRHLLGPAGDVPSIGEP